MFLDMKDIEHRRWILWKLRDDLLAKGYKVSILADFLVSEDISWLEEQGTQVAKKWYIDEKGNDPTLYRGISLGRCIEYDVKARAIRIFKLLRCIERITKRFPNVPIFTDSTDGTIERSVLDLLGIHVFHIDSGPLELLPLTAQPLSFKGHAIKLFRYSGLMFIRWISRLLTRRNQLNNPRVVIRIGLQSSLMLESWLSQPSKDIHFALWLDYLMRPLSVLRLVFSGHSITAPQLNVDATNILSPILENVKNTIIQSASHSISGGQSRHLISKMLVHLSDELFPTVLGAIEAAYKELSRNNTKLLVIPNDCQPLMRSWTLAASALGKSSLVLQHGHLDYIEDGDHHTATHSAFWSDMVATEFKIAGLQTHQILVTGSPNVDEYILRKQTIQTNQLSTLNKRPRVLVITTGNPAVQAYVHETWVCDYAEGILNALRPNLDDYEIEIKLHPGESALLYRKYLGDKLPRHIKINDRGNLSRMIENADIVISPPSTVVIEARAMNKAVILITMQTVDKRYTTLSDADGVITLNRYEDLADTINSILINESRHPKGKLPLEHYLGPLDGGSSYRLLNAVKSLATINDAT